MKVCNKCGLTKPDDLMRFHRNVAGEMIISKTCKDCHSKYVAEQAKLRGVSRVKLLAQAKRLLKKLNPTVEQVAIVDKLKGCISGLE